MPYVICEDVGTTKRRAMTPTRVTRLWEKHKGICVLCGVRIDGTREKWFIEHPRALEMGGPDTDDNAGPAHWSHKAEKDAADHRAAAQAKRRKRAALGITAARPKIQGAALPAGQPARRATTPLAKAMPPRRSLFVPAPEQSR